MEDERVKQDHVAGGARIFNDLQRDAVVLFGAIHEASGAPECISLGV